MSRLIIIRGNSGSGKSTISKKLQLALGYETMLIPLDVVRREILRVRNTPNNPSIQLIYDMALFGKKLDFDVIIEGILDKERYGKMLKKLVLKFKEKSYVYYLDISFEETLRRHVSKSNANEFGEKEMREWWKEKDYLVVKNEKIIPESMNEDEILNMIIKDLSK